MGEHLKLKNSLWGKHHLDLPQMLKLWKRNKRQKSADQLENIALDWSMDQLKEPYNDINKSHLFLLIIYISITYHFIIYKTYCLASPLPYLNIIYVYNLLQGILHIDQY